MTRSLVVSCALVMGCGSDDVPAIGSEIAGCDGAALMASDPMLSMRGVWPVGARTVSIGSLTAEVWYPAEPGSEAGLPTVRYDIRTALPPAEAAKIPTPDNPWQDCACTRDLPLDTAHGPYPVIVFVHGTAAFRHQSLALVTHWASRGFVVLAADHPGLTLRDLIGSVCGGPSVTQDLQADLDRELAAIADPRDQLGFLAGHVDASQVAIAGHSAGGNAAALATGKPGVRVAIAMAANRPAAPSTTLASTLFLAGSADTVVSPNQAEIGWSNSPVPRRFVRLADAGHLAFSDLCATVNAEGQDLLDIAVEHGVCGAQLAGALFDCDPAYLDAQTGWNIINHAATGVLEPTLQCQPQSDLTTLTATYPAVDRYLEQLR
ncbi:MAG: hypothetical protein SFX73_12275 [Kofleriaceae bacterium]|nr:hypothetical protein [Kofleriaceae bacterium]